jgi:hypothetical protein
MLIGIAAMVLGLLAIFLGKKMNAWNERNMEKLAEQKRQKEEAKKAAEANK